MEKNFSYINSYIKNKLKLFIILFFLIVGIVLPSIISIQKELHKEVRSKLYELDLVGEITKGTKHEEKIYLPKNILRYGIMFATYERKNKGTIKIKIVQENKEKEEILDESKLKDNSFYYLNVKNMKSGEALLIIEGIDGTEGNAVSVHKTSDIMYGELIQNGEATNRSLVHDIEFYDINTTVKGQVIFLILSLISYFYFLMLMKNEKKNNKKIYFVTVLFIFFMMNVKAPTLTFNAQPFAEQVFNFMYNGTHKNFLQNIFWMDAGYWPLYQRIIGLIIIKLGFNASITGFLLSNFAVLLVALMVSVFTLDYFEKYVNILFRFIIIMPYTETHTFINFSYVNIVLIIFISLIDFEKLERKKYILFMVLTFFLCISKSHYVILLPIAVLLLFLLFKKLHYREKIYLVIISIALIFQIIYTYQNMAIWIRPEENKLTILQIINIGTHQVIQQFINLFFSGIGLNIEVENMNIMFLFIFIIMIIFFVYLLIKNKGKEEILLLSLIALMLGSSYLNVISRIWTGEKLWTTAFGAINSRHASLIKMSLIALLIILPYSIQKSNEEKKEETVILKERNILNIIVIIFLLIRYSPVTVDSIYKGNEIHSDWKRYSKFYDTKNFLIPVEPYFMNENEKAYYIGKETNESKVVVLEGEKFYINGKEKIQELELPKPTKIEFLYTKRIRDYNFDRIRLIGFDKNNNIVLDLTQLNDKERSYIGFKNNNPNVEITKISFINEINKQAYVVPEIFIGEPKSDRLGDGV